MAIYVYNTATGVLVSWVPNNLTIAQAQALGYLAPNSILSANGLTAIDGLHVLDDTHVWNATTKTVDTVAAPPTPNVVDWFTFVNCFTSAEWAAIQASGDAKVKRWVIAQGYQPIDLNGQRALTATNYLVNQGVITGARQTQILAGQQQSS